MKRDVLDAAAESLRDTRAELSVSAREGAARVLRDVKRQSRHRRMARVAFVQVFALLVGFGAWAAGSGRLDRFVRETVWRAQPEHRVPGSSPRKSKLGVVDHKAHLDAPPMEPVPISPATSPTSPVQVAPPKMQPRRPLMGRPMAPAEKAVVEQPTPTPLQLYEAAHEAHFGRKDWHAALVLWDVYLKSGDPSFSVEARYNRALALVRLGKNEDAAQALRPFADGEYGSYRRQDALRLLQWLAGRAP